MATSNGCIDRLFRDARTRAWLTANAMKGDREECLAAGMDDYVIKLTRVDQMVALTRVSARGDR